MSEWDDRKKKLREFLDSAVEDTVVSDRLANDPVGIVREFDDPADQEVVAFIAAALAYGRVTLVRDAIRRALAPLGASPARVLAARGPQDWVGVLDDFVYRMTRGADLIDLYAALGAGIREHGSLQGVYLAAQGEHLQRASGLVVYLREHRIRSNLARGLRYLLVDPTDGSAAKRLHMFFRWVVRGADGVDLGLWTSADPTELVMPLDTHTSRIARYIGLSARTSVDLKAAVAVTSALAELRPNDPVYYDFALAHLGISGGCIHRRSEDHCPGCPLEPVCTLT